MARVYGCILSGFGGGVANVVTPPPWCEVMAKVIGSQERKIVNPIVNATSKSALKMHYSCYF